MTSKSEIGRPATAEGQSQDLSMEEILASIRRIVTEDHPTDMASASTATADNVYDLTQVVADDGHVTDVRLVQTASPKVTDTPSSRPAQGQNSHGLMSDKVVDTVTQQLMKLNQAQQERQVENLVNELRQETTLESLVRDMVKPFITNWLENNYETLVVKMLKKWMEKNLPDVVERLVNEEIRKLTHPTE